MPLLCFLVLTTGVLSLSSCLCSGSPLMNDPLVLLSLPVFLRSILSDLAKTASDLRQSNTRALEQLAEAIIPRLKPILDEVAAVRRGEGE